VLKPRLRKTSNLHPYHPVLKEELKWLLWILGVSGFGVRVRRVYEGRKLDAGGIKMTEVLMQARMKNIALIVPEAMQALHRLKASAEKGGVPSRTLDLVELRASQINGCSVCVDMHSRDLKAVTDGPYVEVKDFVQGFMIVSAENVDQAYH
jgi:AhpD family alkylhydroperoxidase